MSDTTIPHWTHWTRVDWNDPTTFPSDGLIVRVFRSNGHAWAAWEGMVRSYFSGHERKVDVSMSGPMDLGVWDEDVPAPGGNARPTTVEHHLNRRNNEPVDTIWWRLA